MDENDGNYFKYCYDKEAFDGSHYDDSPNDYEQEIYEYGDQDDKYDYDDHYDDKEKDYYSDFDSYCNYME